MMMGRCARGLYLSGWTALMVGLVPTSSWANNGGEGNDSSIALSSIALSSQPQSEYENLREALKGGRVWLNFRYRYEYVDDDAFSRSANANTLRTALGYETGLYHGFKGLIEFEDVADITDNYNSTTNGKTQYPVVADPDHTEVNQVFLDYTGFEDILLRAGRQEVNLDNQRFVGSVAWRQNHQTVEAAAIIASGVPNLTAFYAYVDRVNRVFGDDHPVGDLDTSTHLFNFGYDIEGVGKASAYLYYLDLDDVAALSSNTVGVRFAGEQNVGEGFDVLYAGEFANQTDAADNPNDLDQDYYLLEVGAKFSGVTVKGALEHLGGSGDTGDAFQTPLATLHKFNGWADLFLGTPVDGLVDTYFQVNGKQGRTGWLVRYHQFDAATGSANYGDEIDAQVTYKTSWDQTFALKAALYGADQFGVDTDKWMFWTAYSF